MSTRRQQNKPHWHIGNVLPPTYELAASVCLNPHPRILAAAEKSFERSELLSSGARTAGCRPANLFKLCLPKRCKLLLEWTSIQQQSTVHCDCRDCHGFCVRLSMEPLSCPCLFQHFVQERFHLWKALLRIGRNAVSDEAATDVLLYHAVPKACAHS